MNLSDNFFTFLKLRLTVLDSDDNFSIFFHVCGKIGFPVKTQKGTNLGEFSDMLSEYKNVDT